MHVCLGVVHQWLGRVTSDAPWLFTCSECRRRCGADVTLVRSRGTVTICFRGQVLVSTIAFTSVVVGFCVATFSCSKQVISILVDVVVVLFLCVFRVYIVVHWMGSIRLLVPNDP